MQLRRACPARAPPSLVSPNGGGAAGCCAGAAAGVALLHAFTPGSAACWWRLAAGSHVTAALAPLLAACFSAPARLFDEVEAQGLAATPTQKADLGKLLMAAVREFARCASRVPRRGFQAAAHPAACRAPLKQACMLARRRRCTNTPTLLASPQRCCRYRRFTPALAFLDRLEGLGLRVPAFLVAGAPGTQALGSRVLRGGRGAGQPSCRVQAGRRAGSGPSACNLEHLRRMHTNR